MMNGYNIKDIANKFIKWNDEGYQGEHNQVFDIGVATQEAIYDLKQRINPAYQDEMTNIQMEMDL